MALTKEKLLTSVDCKPTNFHIIQIQENNVVKEDGVIIAEKFHRRVLHPGYKDSEGNYAKTDTSAETEIPITTMIENCWTGVNDQAYAAHLGATWIDELMKELIHMLSLVPADTEVLAVAKGKNYLSNRWKDLHRINKQMKGLWQT